MRALVTGAGGFIGGAAVAALRARGVEVREGRRPAFDLDRPETLAPALEGVETVVHGAYRDIAAMPKQAEALVRAMERAGARRLVALSSIAVYGEADGFVDESAPLTARDPYGRAKIACEVIARGFSGGTIVLRPGIVYGAGSRLWVDKLSERIRAGAWGDFGPLGEGVAALIHVNDLAAMIAALAVNGPGVTLNAVGPETPTWNAYFAALAQGLGAPPPPRLSAREIARARRLAVLPKVWRRLGLPGGAKRALAPTAGELALFSRRAVYSGEAAKALGLAPRIGLAEGLRLTYPARPYQRRFSNTATTASDTRSGAIR
jgi:nucleoside-diphosphate-sugar epimerase